MSTANVVDHTCWQMVGFDPTFVSSNVLLVCLFSSFITLFPSQRNYGVVHGRQDYVGLDRRKAQQSIFSKLVFHSRGGNDSTRFD